RSTRRGGRRRAWPATPPGRASSARWCSSILPEAPQGARVAASSSALLASDSGLSVAEGDGALVADPLPHRNGALDLGAGDEEVSVELLGVEANGADVVAAAGGFVALQELGEGRAALAGDGHGGAVERESDGRFGEEHQGRAAGFGGAHGDEK